MPGNGDNICAPRLKPAVDYKLKWIMLLLSLMLEGGRQTPV